MPKHYSRSRSHSSDKNMLPKSYSRSRSRSRSRSSNRSMRRRDPRRDRSRSLSKRVYGSSTSNSRSVTDYSNSGSVSKPRSFEKEFYELKKRMDFLQNSAGERSTESTPTPEPTPPGVPESEEREHGEHDNQQADDLMMICTSSPSSINDDIQQYLDDHPTDPNDDIIALLGDTDVIPEQNFGPPIHKDIVPRWDLILKNGLNDKNRKEILEKYSPPINFKHLVCPKLNIEVKDAINSQAFQRDERLASAQQQMSSSLVALGAVITNMLEGGARVNRGYIEPLGNACKLLADLHHSKTLTRRELLLLDFTEDFKKILKDAPITEYLFGENLEERVKTARSLTGFSPGFSPAIHLGSQSGHQHIAIPRSQPGQSGFSQFRNAIIKKNQRGANLRERGRGRGQYQRHQ